MRRFFEKQVRTLYLRKTRLSSNLCFSKNFAGFSLIELLVGITIGGIILTIVMGSYAAMTETNMKLDAARQLQKETNFAVIRMADKIRNFPITDCEEEKLILDNGGIKFEFLETQKRALMNTQDLFSANVNVEEIEFKCAGVGDENIANLQPRVQIYLKVSSKRNPEITNWIRTTISSRIYK